MPQTTQEAISIVVNGEQRRIPAGETITGLIRLLGLDPERLAIELDRRIVKRPEWSSTVLGAGARIEIVQFVGGG